MNVALVPAKRILQRYPLTFKCVCEQAIQENFHFNELTPPPATPWWLLFLQHQTGFFSLLLWAAAILALIS